MHGRLTGVKVLIVDDDEDIRDSVQTVMNAEGAQTTIVADGNAAVEAVNKPDAERFDVVVLDMMLPGRSGFLVLEKIKGHEDSPAVIMLTANEGKRHQAYAESLGVDQYLLKPVPMERLVSVAAELATSRAKGRRK
jgi:DNA-binding response OmpR family regulator